MQKLLFFAGPKSTDKNKNYLGELTFNSLVSLITRLFLTVVSSLYITHHSLVSRVSLMFEELLLPGTNFRNKVYK